MSVNASSAPEIAAAVSLVRPEDYLAAHAKNFGHDVVAISRSPRILDHTQG
jgi:hypothetical protein